MGWFKKKAEIKVSNEDVSKVYADFEKQASLFSALKQKIIQLQNELQVANQKLNDKDAEIKRLNILLDKVITTIDDLKKVR